MKNSAPSSSPLSTQSNSIVYTLLFIAITCLGRVVGGLQLK
jgi:hypothetical protein